MIALLMCKVCRRWKPARPRKWDTARRINTQKMGGEFGGTVIEILLVAPLADIEAGVRHCGAVLRYNREANLAPTMT